MKFTEKQIKIVEKNILGNNKTIDELRADISDFENQIRDANNDIRLLQKENEEAKLFIEKLRSL